MNRVNIKPGLLIWARKRAGQNERSLRKKFPKLDQWETSQSQPTLKQLEKLAKTLYVPIGYFFLNKPPEEQVPIPDFRRMNGVTKKPLSPDLLETIYMCQRRQDWYREYRRSEKMSSFEFIGSVTPLDSNVVQTANKIRTVLNFDIEQRKDMPTWTEALRQFVEITNSKGILVMSSGIVGNNNHRKLNPKEFRGFALSDSLAPLIFINKKDTKAAQMFTLAHELAHLWTAQTAVSNMQTLDAIHFPKKTFKNIPHYHIERWCNKVAAELLVPLKLICKEVSVSNRKSNFNEEVQRLARYFKVSSLVILRRLYDIQQLTVQEFKEAYKKELKKLEKMQKRDQTDGGDFFRTFNTRLPPVFTQALIASTLEGYTPFREAFQLLGIRTMSTFQTISKNHKEDF